MKRSSPQAHTSTSSPLPKHHKICKEQTAVYKTVKQKFKHGTVITLIASPAETIAALGPGFSLVDPDPDDPFFKDLCYEVEASMGITVENKPVEDHHTSTANNPMVGPQLEANHVEPLLITLAPTDTEDADSEEEISSNIDELAPGYTDYEKNPAETGDDTPVASFDASDKETSSILQDEDILTDYESLATKNTNTASLTSEHEHEDRPLVDLVDNEFPHVTVEYVHSVDAEKNVEKEKEIALLPVPSINFNEDIKPTLSSQAEIAELAINTSSAETFEEFDLKKLPHATQKGNTAQNSNEGAEREAGNASNKILVIPEESPVVIKAEDIYRPTRSSGLKCLMDETLSMEITRKSKVEHANLPAKQESATRILPKVEYMSRSKYRKAMKEEMKADVPDMSILKKLMKDTYDMRRELIEHEAPVKLILRDFPALRLQSMIRQEFCQLCKSGITVLIRCLRSTFKTILSKEKESPKLGLESSLARQALAELDKSETSQSYDPKRESLKMSVCMVLFCIKQIGHFDPGTLFVYSNTGQERNDVVDIPDESPFIVVTKGSLVGTSSSFDIYAERNKVVTTNNFFDAMLNVYMLYWILWMKYKERTKSIFEAFDAMFPNGRKQGRGFYI